MHAKPLILTLILSLGAGAAAATIKYGHTEAARAAQAVETAAPAVPRIVVVGSRAHVAEAPVARIVVIARRTEAGTGSVSRN